MHQTSLGQKSSEPVLYVVFTYSLLQAGLGLTMVL